MIGLSSTYLGLALSDKSIACAEMSVNGDQHVRRTATFVFPPEFSFEKPEAAGQALATFLRQHRFRASRAVVGVPVRWLLATERDVPPSDLGQAHSILRLHAERLGSAENGEMIFDYAGPLASERGGRVLLVGILRRQLECIEAVLDCAGLSVTAVTPAALAMASILQEPGDRNLLILGGQGAELVCQRQGGARLLRHLAVVWLEGQDTPALAALGSELRRIISLTGGAGGGSAGEIVLVDNLGLSEKQVGELAVRARLGIRKSAGVSSLGLGEVEEPACLSAVALAAVAARHQEWPLDFRRSRLAPPRANRLGRRTFWTAALAVTAMVALGSFGWSVRQRQIEAGDLKAQLDAMHDEIAAAGAMLDNFKYARGFFNDRPAMLDCLREITLAFDDNDPIWVTSFSLHEPAKGQPVGAGQLAGKAENQKSILSLCGRLQKTHGLADARILQMAEVNAPGGKTKEQSFTIGFSLKSE